MTPVFEILGIAGIAIAMLAYLPQAVHLAKEHCSAGVSRRAWAMWLVSSLLVGALALHRRDLVFILLQISSMTSAAVILSLAHRYRGMVCETHARGYPRGVDGAGQARRRGGGRRRRRAALRRLQRSAHRVPTGQVFWSRSRAARASVTTKGAGHVPNGDLGD
jgi:lipid-A-disaccharide synthase-like uncharacterized protein